MRSSGVSAALPGRVRARWMLVVIAIMAVLTVGWPLLNLAVSNRQQLAAYTRLTVGTGRNSDGTVTIGPGWTMLSSESDPEQVFAIRRGGVSMTISYVALVNGHQTADLYAGLRKLVQVGHPGATMSGPRPIVTLAGHPGSMGMIRGADLVGMASAFAGPSRLFAIEMVVTAPRTASRENLHATRVIMSTLTFGPRRR
jgi:hypothetical protein